MKTISNKSKKRKQEKDINNIKNLLVFKQRANYPNEFQLRIDNINKNVYTACYSQWIKKYIFSTDKIYMRIRKNNNKLTHEVVFYNLKQKFSIDIENFVAYTGNDEYCYESGIHYAYKPNIIKLTKIDCDILLENILAEFDKLNIEYNL